MKSMEIRKVGSILAGTAMLGAALSAPVLAGMDSTGIAKGFFYDTNFKPIVKIVVGEKGMATDAVAAGNIAATVGNLAYMTKTVTPGGASYAPEGQVVITTAARGAVGDYVQDTDIEEATDAFYDEDEGFQFEGEKTYEKGDFTSYTLACDKQTRTEAGLLMEGSYSNIHCLFCQNLCLEALENPSHDMKETITVDSEGIRYYESGLGDDDSENLRMSIDKGSVLYTVETDFLPLKRISKDAAEFNCDGADCYIDFEYRGKMILFGEEYYVKDIDGDKIYLSQAKVLDDVTSEGFTAEYNGYKFKVDHLIYAAEFKVAGILLDVEKPDGTRVQVQISKMANGVVDNLEISGVTAEEAASLQSASIIVYDLSTQVILEDGEDLEIGGEVKTDWEVEFDIVNTCEDDADCDISEYDDMDEDSTDSLLKEVTVTYNHDLDGDEALEKDESLMFPNNFRLTYKGYLTNDYEESPCSGAGEGNIMVEKGDGASELVVSFTGEDGNRYNEVRLDEGQFKKNDIFLVNGVLYKYDSYDKDDNDAGDTDDEVEVTLDPQIRGNKVKIQEIQRYCDPEDNGVAGTYTGENCEDIGDIDIRMLALTDALKDDAVAPYDDNDYENDDVLTLDSYDLFIKEDAISGLDVLFDDSDNSIFFADDFDTDRSIGVNADMVGVFDDFEVDGYELEMSVIVEDGLADDPDSENYVAADDVNDDGDDDDTIVVFETDDGDVYIDLTDRDYDDDLDSSYSTSVALYDVAGDLVLEMDEDTDTLLITPEGGDQFTIDWGTDDRVDAVDLCHPEDDVDSTYFIGTVEEETVAESTITKADEGKEVSAGCCTFTVSKFEVTAGEATTDATATAVVNPITGDIVVPEIAVSGDTSSNLVIVGGPAVNTMCTVTADEISAASDKFVVRKDGNMVIVAGWNADDTVAAGNELIKWLKANVHA
ncbi:MAG: S-layer protein [Candidatus Altiarchaeota archaeon]|nr:S-layer protein [Candidatus Altiarchaeota archaeon]